MSKKVALSVGINYPGTSHSLRGCVNDSYMIRDMLVRHFEFDEVVLLLDEEATTENIRSALHTLIANTTPGDVLFFHYSGHGSQLPDKASDDDFEPDGLDEIICPIDLNWKDKVIRDDELKAIFDTVPDGVSLTVFLDCCNSGGGMDHLNQYQSDTSQQRNLAAATISETNRFLVPPKDIVDFSQSKKLTAKPRALTRNINSTSLLISGCQSQQTSADAYIGGEYRGAATYYLHKCLSEANFDTNYVDLIDKVNFQVKRAGFSQRPELNGEDGLFKQKFLHDLLILPEIEVDAEVDVEPELVVDFPEKKKDSRNSEILLGILAVAAVAGGLVYTLIIR